MKTTLRKLISEIDFNKQSVQNTPNWEDLSNIFNIYDLYWSDDTRLKCYFIKKWYCTDSYVGLRAYFLDDEFVATSYQQGRKFNEDFTFVSKEKAEKVRNYLISLIEPEGIDVEIFKEELDEEIPSTYKIVYNSQILHKTALYNGERVDIIKTTYDWREIDKYFHTVEIKDKNNKKFEVHVNELDFEYNV